MRLPRMAFLVLGVGGLGSQLGCQPAIGDACVQSTDCSIRGDRVCDTSQPAGYCTILGCLGNTCPNGSSCVALDPSVPGCEYDDRRSPSRSTRTLCLKQCNTNTDCRFGYSCQDVRQSPWRGRPLDNGINGQTILYKVCVVGSVTDASAVSTETPVCSPNPPQNMTPIDGGSDADATSDAAPDASEAGSDAANEAGDAGTD